MKVLLICTLFFIVAVAQRTSLDHSLAYINFPSKFIMKEKILTVGVDYVLEDNGNEFAFVNQKIVILKKRYELKNKDNQLISIAEQALYLGLRRFDITDSTGKKLGSIIVKAQFGFITTNYQIRDLADQIVGSVEYKHLFGKKYITVRDKNGKQEAYFQNRFFSFFQKIIDVEFKGNSIDRRLLIFLPSAVIIRN